MKGYGLTLFAPMRRYGLTAFAARRITLHPIRWLLLGVALASVTFLTAASTLMRFAVEETASHVIEAGPALVVSRVHAGGWAPIEQRHAARIASIPGVHSATPRLWGVLPGPPACTVIADPNLHGKSNEAHVGSSLRPTGKGNVLVLRGIDGKAHELHITASIEPGADIVAHDTALVSDEVARSLLLLPPDAATDIAVSSARDEENDALVQEIARELEVPVRVTTRAQMLGAYRTRLGRAGTFELAAFLPAILGLLLLVGTTASGGAMSRADVGKLKLLGWSTREVARLHAIEVGMVATVSVALALACAYASVFAFGASAMSSIVLGWQEPLPHLMLSTQGAALSLLVIGATVLVPCLAAAVIPALRLARVDPIELIEAP